MNCRMFLFKSGLIATSFGVTSELIPDFSISSNVLSVGIALDAFYLLSLALALS